uniref:Uncharacterized protein n=1 Tax=Oryza meridionalis TaxID=40149 RepID=A0A0E0CR90_9ORYZ
MVATSSQLVIHDDVSSDTVSATTANGNGGIVLAMIKNWLRSLLTTSPQHQSAVEAVAVHGVYAPAEALSLLEHGGARAERR